MEPAADLHELTERIRQAANRENAAQAVPGGSPSASGLPLPSEALPSPMVIALTADILDQAKQMLPRAHRKNEVPKTVPKLLRPLYRNQGGFNGVTLEVMERLVTANRQLAEQMGKFREWADAIGQDQAQTHAWARALEARIESFRDERLVEIEVRLTRLEQHGQSGDRPQGRPTDTPAEARLAEVLTRLERLETQSPHPPSPHAGASVV